MYAIEKNSLINATRLKVKTEETWLAYAKCLIQDELYF